MKRGAHFSRGVYFGNSLADVEEPVSYEVTTMARVRDHHQ